MAAADWPPLPRWAAYLAGPVFSPFCLVLPFLTVIAPRPEIRQHNALINSSFVLNTLEWRAFTAILARIHPDDEEFKEYFIPATELVGDEMGGSAYSQIKSLARRLLHRTLYVELLGPDGERVSKPDYEFISFITKARYVRQHGGLFVKVNPDFVPYLLQLTQRGNFTKSLTAELRSLHSSHSFKIYWLLSEYRAFGNRTFTVEDLRFRLGIRADEYTGRFNNFKAKVLDKAQEELAATDLRFEMELLRVGKAVKQIRFTFSPLAPEPAALAARLLVPPASALPAPPAPVPAPTPEPEPWATALLALGVSEAGCGAIRQQLAEGRYPVGYLAYVVEGLSRPRKARIRKPADYVYKCITGALLLDEYERHLAGLPAGPTLPARRGAPAPAPTETVYKLAEVRAMYDNPGPYARRTDRAPTFEAYLERLYLSQGFVPETREGVAMLVLRSI